MKITIITATYNSGSTIRDTLECIRSQDHGSIEHIIVDGKSSDDTLKTVQEFGHVSQVISEKDEGIYDAMNKGIALASGEVIGILNSDDLYTGPDVVSLIARTFSDPEVKTTYGDLQYIDPKNTDKVVRTWKAGNYHKRNFYFGWMPPHPTFFVRREVYEKAGPFDLSLHSAADYELMLRILLRHGMPSRYIPRTLVRMRAGGMSNASFKNRIIANREDRQAWKLNGLEPHFFTLYAKPIRKISQFLIR